MRGFVKRALAVPGMTNMRDIGGYMTTTPFVRVRQCLVYRSDSPHNVTPEVAQRVLVEQLHLTHAFDFRSPDEVAQKPYAFTGIEHVLVPIGGSLVKQLYRPDVDLTPTLARDLVHRTYRKRIDECGDQFAKVLSFLASPAFAADGTQSILFHCTAGKDRTGLMAAIILHLLGVPRSTILDDYMLTNRFFQPPTERNAYFDAIKMDREVHDILWHVDEAFLEAALDYVEERYGGMDAYAKTKLGLDAAAVERLRERLLE
ncbi:Tyrosine phosphatase family [Lotmaria passim]